MLLIMCHANLHRYAIDSRDVSEVLPRVILHPLAHSAPWLAGLLVHRGSATPVVDLVQLSAGTPCANRLSSRIIVLQTELRGSVRRVGLLAEQVGLVSSELPMNPSAANAPVNSAGTAVFAVASGDAVASESRNNLGDATRPPAELMTGSTMLGTLCLDEQGVFELIDIPSLISEDRQAFLFPAAERGQ